LISIPPEVAIKATIRPGSVYYFPEESFNTEEPHYFIVINIEPLTDRVVILVCASSQIDKIKVRRNTCPSDTLIEIGTLQYCDFKVNSIIDCNYVLEKNIDQLIEKLKNGKLALKSEMDIKLVNQLRQGVLNSPVIERRIKEILERKTND
jgi:hypothetical protein